MSLSTLYEHDTIVAPTAPLGGAVVMFRLSGSEACTIAQRLFRNPRGKEVDFSPRYAHYGYLMDETELLDEVTLTYYQAPKSYTGEDVVEISCHASPYISQRAMELFIAAGARIAQPGEFTFRSFLNGKRDMAEAEAVGDVIAAESRTQLQVAMAQLKGSLSLWLREIREKMLRFTALMELELDFSEEDVEFADRTELIKFCQELRTMLGDMIASFDKGNKLRHGVKTVLAGIPNSGKSSLLNALLGEERAIVTDIEGTTRDAISETIILQGIPFHFTDTAGIRQTSDPIEKLGVAKSFEYVEKSDLRLLLIDADRLDAIPIKEQVELIPSELLASKETLFILNKVDLLASERLSDLTRYIQEQYDKTPLLVSAKKETGLQELTTQLVEASGCGGLKVDALITNVRHLTHLKETDESLQSVLQGLKRGLSPDLLTGDLRQAIQALGEITGDTISSEEVLHQIFASFCIGK